MSRSRLKNPRSQNVGISVATDQVTWSRDFNKHRYDYNEVDKNISCICASTRNCAVICNQCRVNSPSSIPSDLRGHFEIKMQSYLQLVKKFNKSFSIVSYHIKKGPIPNQYNYYWILPFLNHPNFKIAYKKTLVFQLALFGVC